MAAADRLSDLPDDLLRRVLYFVPAKEGASTAVLSRRWRSLWRSCGAVNLDSRSYKPLVDDLEGEDFLQDAMAALAVSAAQGPVRRLNFHMEGSHKFHIHRFLSYGQDESERNLIGEVMASPATRNAEELRIAGLVPNMSSYPCLRGGYYKLSVDDLPHEALGVLHIVNAELEVGWSGALFPRLNSLLLRGCHVSFQNLQAMIHPAPQLTTVRLESIFLLRGRHGEDDSSSTSSNHGCQIRGLEVTTLVLTDWSSYNGSMTMENLEFDMPKLQYFRYEWFSRFQVSLKSWANNLTQVDFHFNKDSIYDQDEAVVSFWHFLRNFSNAKVFNLKLDCPINEIAVTDMKSLDELLDNKLLFNLERLEVDGCYNREEINAAGTAIANLLHCCPIVGDLRLRINALETVCHYQSCPITRKAQLDFDKSVKHFKHRRGTSGANDDKYKVSDIPGLSNNSLHCLQSYLRRVSLQFRNENKISFGEQLVKFFAENAMVLQEMHIYDGNRKMCEHLDDMVRRWALNSIKRRNWQATKSFRVLAMESDLYEE